MILALVLGFGHEAVAQTVQDFDAPGTTYALAECAGPPGASVTSGGPTGSFLRLATEPSSPPSINTITFDRTDVGTSTLVVADFDLRLKPKTGRADGLGFALLNTQLFESGAVCPQPPRYISEEPDFPDSVGLGFDIQNGVGDISDNHVSVHYDGALLTQVDVQGLDLAGGHWIHVRVSLRMRPAGDAAPSDVSVVLTSPDGRAVTVLDAFAIPGLTPYEGRVHFGARTDAAFTEHDLDNIRVLFSNASPAILAFAAGSFGAVESDASAAFSVARTGDVQQAVSIGYETADLTADAGSDYASSSGTLTFQPGETTRTLSIPLLDDALAEGNETFLIRLIDPDGGALVGGPSAATIHLADDESGRTSGHWSEVLMWPHVAIHMVLLPTEQVMFWEDRGQDHEVALWDPRTGAITTPSLPGHDIFCAGHSFLSDGRLLVTGGHVFVGADGYAGLNRTAAYNPFTNSWAPVPAMNAGRWYPTNTTLGNGDVLVISGDIRNVPPAPPVRNFLPQVWVAASGTWRNLVGAQDPAAHGGDLYPRMILAPDGRVFKAGPDTDTWFLDVSGSGGWTPGPVMQRGIDPSVPAHERIRKYAPAVMRDQKVFIFGGGENPPASSVETLDLDAATLSWVQVPSMAHARRHHNATLLPDGKILITGGTGSSGFNSVAGAVLDAELYDPDTNTWSTLAPMQVKRLYHATALLLPDGRVLSAGGGQPAPDGDHDHRDAEIYSPPYLFMGPRPTIIDAPASAVPGQTFSIATADAATISKASLIRIGAVTHAFDQNQRYISLVFSTAPDGLQLTVPSNPNICPPGHYMLFVVNAAGVPSVARMIRIDPDPTDDPPTIAPVSNQSTDEDVPAGPIAFTVDDVDTPSAQLVVSGVSDNGALVPNGGITFSGSGASRAVTLAPAANQAGTATITVTVSDGTTSTSTSFLLTVAAVNDPPTITAIGRQTVSGDRATGAIGFTVGDVDTAAASLTVSGHSSNPALVPDANIVFGGSATSRTVTITPAASQSGPATITVTVSDGTLSASTSFLLTKIATQGDFNGDTAADIAVYRPSTGFWYVRNQAAIRFGDPGDIPVPGDYNGDGRTDIAVYRPRTGQWFVRNQFTLQFGDSGDIPVPGDYNGDGTTDLAVYRPSTGGWFVRSQLTVAGFGGPDHVPVVADYNGDGATDIAVYRPSTGSWYVRNQLATQFGSPGDLPVPADFDGDGSADLAVYRPTTGFWYVRNQLAARFGTQGDLPVARDFDGNGTADIAVYRPANGEWFVRNQFTVQFGEPTDVPVPRPPSPLAATNGDYNADNVTDVAVYRAATGMWFVRNQFAVQFGDPTDEPVPADYNGDGRMDVAVYRPSTGLWFVRNQLAVQFGDPGDAPAAGDYDGDGRADVAVFRQSTGMWYIRNKPGVQFGSPGDIPVPGDYNGDGTIDLATYRPSTGFWYVRNQFAVQFGGPGYVPVPGDYNGDGLADLATFRASTGTWSVRNQFVVHFGDSTDTPVPGDYNGDGITDVAVYRQSTGTWYVRNQFAIQFGDSTDVPVVGVGGNR